MTAEDISGIINRSLHQIDDILKQGQFSQSAEGFPTETELHDIRAQLERVHQEICSGTLPEKRSRKLWIGRILTDGWWNFRNDPLYDDLLTISDVYLRKLPS